MNIEEFCRLTGLVNFVCCLLFAIFIFSKNPRERTHQIFALFSFFVALWSFGYFCFHSYNADYESADFWIRFLTLGCCPIPAVFLHFVVTLLQLNDRPLYKWLVGFAYIFFFSLILFSPTSLMVASLEPKHWYRLWPNPGFLWHFYTAGFFITVLFSHYLLFRAAFHSTGVRRKQLMLVAVGTLITFSGGSTNFFLWYDITIAPVLNGFGILYIIIVFYAVLNYQFLQVEDVLAIHRDKLMLLGLMSSSLTHEIKNPLFLVKGYTDKITALAQKKNDTEIADALRHLSSQVSRMSTLVTRLSDFGKPNPNPGKQEDVDVAQALEDALFFAEQELKHHNIEVVKKIELNLPKLKGDKSQFEEIFLNLIMNAFHSMKNGGKLTIEAKIPHPRSALPSPSGRGEGEGGIEVIISDSGTGISKENLKNIFKPFYSTKGKQGTGLGLHIVKTLVEQNSGKISVESEVGKGTRFKLLFNAELRV